MHIARIGAVKDLDCKHPKDPVGRGKNASEIPAECSYSQQKSFYSFIRNASREQKGRLQSIGRKDHMVTRTDAASTSCLRPQSISFFTDAIS